MNVTAIIANGGLTTSNATNSTLNIVQHHPLAGRKQTLSAPVTKCPFMLYLLGQPFCHKLGSKPHKNPQKRHTG